MNKRQHRRLEIMFVLLQTLAVAIIAFGIFLVVANWPAFSAMIGYDVNPPSNPIIIYKTPSPTATPSPVIVEAPHITIPKIGVDVPIIWNAPIASVLDDLSHGVVQLAGTAGLGETGNMVIMGHSSDFLWKHNPYASAFALLPKIEKDDVIIVRQNGKAYVYTVTDKQVVKPDAVNVADPTNSSVLTLVTCYPIGTATSRLVIRATLTSSPDGAPKKAATAADQTLPVINFR